MFVFSTIAFFAYAWSEKQIGRANDLRHHSYLLANELRQSSDDLTIMASTYVVTGDPAYKKYFQDILDVRDGKKPWPESHQNMYGDVVLANGEQLGAGSEQPIALLALIRQIGLTGPELDKLELAKANSDRLVATEVAAMKLIDAPGRLTEDRQAVARMMLHDEKYHQAKADIIKPINEFNELMEKRTSNAIRAAETMALILRVVFIGFGLSLMLMLLRTNNVLRTIMGGSVDEVYAYIARIGRGDFSVAPAVAEDKQNSVLGWLAKAQANLNTIDRELNQAKKLDQFHRQTLELLASRDSLQEILENLVRGVEQFNPAMLCSVFLLDKEGKHLVNGIAPSLPNFYNEATTGIEIGLGVGSCGTAAFTGQRVIVENISTHPYWGAFRECAARAGLGACWSQPIYALSGKVLGTFSIYHRDAHTPTDADIALIEELSRQASIAIERSIDAEKIRDSEAHYRLLTEDVSDVVWKQDREHRFTYISPADERMRGFSADEVIGSHAFDMMTEEGIVSARA
ncbi:MAG TPA: GAF domain-containing protein, partial [Gallionella sp.]|nr:GAF domain-containing protein [Gallionella sp.]